MTVTGAESDKTATRPLSGKVALVVGGGWATSQGERHLSADEEVALSIGASVSQHLVQQGCLIGVLDISEENAERTMESIREGDGDAFKIVADTAADADCERSVREVLDHYGQLDILINNVGIGSAGAGYEPGSEEAFDRIMAVNFRGVTLMAKHATEPMPSGGSIVNVGSVFGAVDPIPGAYPISKSILAHSLTPALAALYARQGIRVNTVSVGYLWNSITQLAKDMQAPDVTMDEYRRGRADTLSALRTEGDGWDVAEAVAFLASDKARWITGQDLMVDGGYSLLNVFDHSLYGREGRAGSLGSKR